MYKSILHNILIIFSSSEKQVEWNNVEVIH